ncbi:MAG: IS110 family transposase [Cyclobacteriaceae bacterium]
MATKLVNPNASGIDVSSTEHVVAVPEDRTKNSVRTFKGFTRDLHQLARWLVSCKIETVAMESTGVYWFDLYTILLDYDFEVYLVNAHHVKNVPGRKSDVSDARWLQELHTFGLLRASFQPDNLTRSLRNHVRQRKDIIRQMTRETQHMQKAFDQMNIKLNNVIRDLNGTTGTKIITAILNGERDAEKLARHRDRRIKASKETLIKSLEGNWRDEQVFNLRLAYDHYVFLQSQLEQCDAESEKTIKKMTSEGSTEKKADKVQRSKNNPSFDVSQYLYTALGVEVTRIYGIKETTALTIFSETGIDLKEKFPTEKQFLSWLNVVPNNKITGGKVISSKVKKKKNKAGQAFRDAASALWRAQNPIGDYLRRKKAKSGGRKAVVGTARKIAAIYYKMVVEKVEFDPHQITKNKGKYLQNKLEQLERAQKVTKKLLADYQEESHLVI